MPTVLCVRILRRTIYICTIHFVYSHETHNKSNNNNNKCLYYIRKSLQVALHCFFCRCACHLIGMHVYKRTAHPVIIDEEK